MSSLYPQSLSFSPARSILSPQLRAASDVESHYLTELLAERQNLEPFIQIFPNCRQLLDQEILNVSGRIANHGFNDHGFLQFCGSSPVVFPDILLDMAGNSNWNGNGWNTIQPAEISMPQGVFLDWQPVLEGPSLVKKILRMEVPIDRYPNFNFMGRLLGPRGNSLKRIEAATCCRIFIRGKGSVKDPAKEERLRGKPGHEHLNEPLHIIIEAHLPANLVDGQLKQAKEIIQNILKPMDASQDLYKREQFKELAMLNNSIQV